MRHPRRTAKHRRTCAACILLEALDPVRRELARERRQRDLDSANAGNAVDGLRHAERERALFHALRHLDAYILNPELWK